MAEIDLYLIAGQSNAAGFTKVRDAEALYGIAPALREGFDHVLYAGNARADADQWKRLINRDVAWCPTRLGLGAHHEGYMGPEAGMAVVLSKRYNAESGRYAGLIKLAHGGTSLLEKRVGSNVFGNWCPPSLAKEQGIAWEGDPITGELYRLLLAQLERNARELHQKAAMDETAQVDIHAVSVGDVAFIAVPYEMFDTTGMHIKEQSPFEMTIVMYLTNEIYGYMPDIDAFPYGLYEVDVTKFVPGTAEIFEQTYLEMLESLHSGL